jgi:hypothetical protein
MASVLGAGRIRWAVLIALAVSLVALAPQALAPYVSSAAGPPQLSVGQGSTDNTVYYVDWTAASAANGTASGVITLADGSTVTVTFAAVFADGSPGSMAFTQTGCGTNYWNPSTPYISTEVPNAPPGCDILALQGGQNQIYRLTLSEAIRDPLMAIVSLGSGSIPTTYDFDSPFTIVSQGTGYWGGTSTSLQQLDGDVLRGTEGHGTIRFLGTFSTFSWTVPTPEYWHGYTFGIRTSEALAQPVTVDEGQLATNSGTWSGEDVSLSASVGTVTKNVDGTWDWSLLTADGPSESQNVTITATNAFGTTTRSFDLVVRNVAPTGTLSNDGPGLTDTPVHVSFSGQSDASSTDTAAGLRYAYACDGGSLEAATYATGSIESFTECTYATAGEVTIRARIIDKDDGFTEYTTVTTIDPAPVVETGPGKVTGGGLKLSKNVGGGFVAQRDADGNVKGELQFRVDREQFHAHIITSLTVSADGLSASFAGVGTDGRGFVVEVEDNGEPGRDDVFRLWIDGVLVAGGPLTVGGNIQIHGSASE